MNALVTPKAPKLFNSVCGHFINGRWVDSRSGATVAQFNPETGEVLARIHRIVWINTYYDLPCGMPIGGYKESGYGREFAWNIFKDYTITTSVIMNLNG
jgi:acyl-CoA reductase-like NAD-dependent aldehyde dehydrogenase